MAQQESKVRRKMPPLLREVIKDYFHQQMRLGDTLNLIERIYGRLPVQMIQEYWPDLAEKEIK